MNVTTRQLLDSQGPLIKKNRAEIKELIKEFSNHSWEYDNPREDKRRGYKDGNGASEELAAVLAKLETMDRRMTKMDQSVHAICVGCYNGNGPHLTKDFHLEKNRNRKVQVFFFFILVVIDLMKIRESQ